MKNDQKSRAIKNKKKARKNPSKPSPAMKAKKRFVPREIDETTPGQFTGFVGGVRPPEVKKES